MIVKYENQTAYTEQTYIHKLDNELRFIYGTNIQSIVFPNERIALACMALILEARDTNIDVLVLSDTDAN